MHQGLESWTVNSGLWARAPVFSTVNSGVSWIKGLWKQASVAEVRDQEGMVGSTISTANITPDGRIEERCGLVATGEEAMTRPLPRCSDDKQAEAGRPPSRFVVVGHCSVAVCSVIRGPVRGMGALFAYPGLGHLPSISLCIYGLYFRITPTMVAAILVQIWLCYGDTITAKATRANGHLCGGCADEDCPKSARRLGPSFVFLIFIWFLLRPICFAEIIFLKNIFLIFWRLFRLEKSV